MQNRWQRPFPWFQKHKTTAPTNLNYTLYMLLPSPPFASHVSKESELVSMEDGRGMPGLEMSLHHPHLSPLPQQQPAFGGGGDHAALGRLSASPWHRMKWTDGMVRLLIMIVYCVGDDADQQAADQPHLQAPAGSAKGKKAASASASAGLLMQKKGKWKSVSLGMMEKGFYVSPQQCEDKFNDLNKRYKRVNELLGKGTACRVVETPALLDSLDRVSPKAKDEARKLLSSKHLFFREMCAYHNSPSLGAAASGGACAPPPHPLQLSSPPHHHHHPHPMQQLCVSHPSDSSSIGTAIHGHPPFLCDNILGGVHEEEDEGKGRHHHHHHDNDTDDDETGDNDELEGEEEEEEDYDEDDDDKKGSSSKLMLQAMGTSLSASPPLSLTMSSSSPPMPTEQLRMDLMGSLAGVGGEQQQRQWLKRKAAELEEQRVVYQCRALKLERQRFKWLRFSSSKEREMEKMRLSNQRLRLENDRMLLLLRQKEQELIPPP